MVPVLCHLKYNCWLQTHSDPETELLIGWNLRSDSRGGPETEHQMCWQKMTVSLSSASPSQEIAGHQLSVSLSAKRWDEIRKKSVCVADVSSRCSCRRLPGAGDKVLRPHVSPRQAGGALSLLLWGAVPLWHDDLWPWGPVRAPRRH